MVSKRPSSKTPPAARGATLRSPAYPCITLEKALRRTFTLSRTLGTKEASADGIARIWGNTSAAGKILSYITALREYGLTEETGRGAARRIQVSALGAQLIRQNPPRELLQSSALNPPPFRELWDSFGTGLAADPKAAVRILCLERTRKGLVPFTERGAEEAFRIFRINAEFVGLNDDDNPFEDPIAVSTNSSAAMSEHEPAQTSAGQQPNADELEFGMSLGSDRKATFYCPKNPTTEEHQHLERMLLALKALIEGLRPS